MAQQIANQSHVQKSKLGYVDHTSPHLWANS